MRILEVEGITRRFGGLVAVSGLDFQIDQGEFVGLIGPNGAGKTTVFNLISGALAPDAGAIRFRGRKISGLRPHQICRMGVARTFQSVKIFPRLSAYENVQLAALFGRGKGASSADTHRDTEEALEFAELSGFAPVPAGDLTLANQKRLEIARALVTRPELLLIDELMAGLNPTEVSDAIQMVRRLGERNITIVMIEHVMKAIMDVCERIIVLHYGEKIAEGPPEAIAANAQVIEIYLGE